MLVREHKESDLDALRSIHAAQSFYYAVPDLRNPLFITKLECGSLPAAGRPSCRFSVRDSTHLRIVILRASDLS